jgi:hypothetical protein
MKLYGFADIILFFIITIVVVAVLFKYGYLTPRKDYLGRTVFIPNL